MSRSYCFLRGVMLCSLIGLIACDHQNDLTNITTDEGIVFSVDPFLNDHSSRTLVDVNNNFQIVWAPGDVVGVFPRDGFQEPFTIPADQLGQSQAVFDGGYWSLKDGLTYAAYYPFDKAYFDSPGMKTKLAVSYRNQQQEGTECKVGSYDYTYSDWMTAEFGSINLKMHHLGAFVTLRLPIPVTTNYYQMEMSIPESLITVEGHYNLTVQTPSVIADRTSATLPVKLKNFSARADQMAEIHFMLPPMNLDQKEITFTLSTESGTCVYSILGKAIKASTRYTINPKPTSCNIPGTTDEWLRKYGIIGGAGGNEDAGGSAPDFGWGN